MSTDAPNDRVVSGLEDLHEGEFVAAFARHKRRTIPLDISMPTAVVIVSQLQLALRHPRNKQHTAAAARAICEALISQMPEEMRPFMEAGFDPRYDQPTGGD